MTHSAFKALVSTMIIPSLALAHSEHVNVAEAGGTFMTGLTHPVLGVDHLAAMLSVGILSAQMGGRAIWNIPATFVLLMLIGGILGILGIPLIRVELGIAVSVFILGIAIAADTRAPILATFLFVGVFGLFHGHAHGTEMPYLAQAEFYAYGFIAGTSGIHLCGLSIGLISNRVKNGRSILRLLGSTIAVFGLVLLKQVIF